MSHVYMHASVHMQCKAIMLFPLACVSLNLSIVVLIFVMLYVSCVNNKLLYQELQGNKNNNYYDDVVMNK